MPNHGPMACPVDGATLVMSERQGVEIDYCPTCRGVWLDRGELDKILDRSAQDAPQAAAPPQQQQQGYQQDYRSHPQSQRYPKRRKSFLEELFD